MKSAQLVYCIVCDDVRIEMGNKLSLMGVFENIFLQSFPAVLLKFAVVNHWEGNGEYETQVKVLNPERREVVASAPSTFTIENNGYADNIEIHYNTNGTQFPEEFIETWRKFRKVEIAFSIDNLGERFEFERSGAKWAEVEAKIGRAHV